MFKRKEQQNSVYNNKYKLDFCVPGKTVSIVSKKKRTCTFGKIMYISCSAGKPVIYGNNCCEVFFNNYGYNYKGTDCNIVCVAFC